VRFELPVVRVRRRDDAFPLAETCLSNLGDPGLKVALNASVHQRLDPAAGVSAKARPVQNDLSGLAGDHRVEALLKIAVGEAMRDHGGNVHS
jgi:hypothetical protein